LTVLRIVGGLLLCLSVWYFVLRWGAGARGLRRAPPLAVGLDVIAVLIGFALFTLALDRPLLAGLAIAALAAGLSLADRVKRIVLDEPVVFADRAELFEVVRHPRLYLPFAGSAFVLGGAGVAVLAAAAGLARLEPALWPRPTTTAAAEAIAAVLAGYGCLHFMAVSSGLVDRIAAFYTTDLRPTRDPAADAQRFGPLATFAIHATLAASERPTRRVTGTPARPALFPSDAGPVVLVQAESFMDPTRLHPTLVGLLPHFAAPAALRGQLAVPAWGANTVRTEFAMLTGLPDPALGLDRYNPYEAFVGPHTKLGVLAEAAKASGYRTVFVHPFDLKFYGRARVLPRLGFNEMVGPAAFAKATRRGAYVADEAIAPVIADLLRRWGPKVFVFAATMEAHGPWPETGHGPNTVDLPESLRNVPESGQLGRWLWHLQGTDRMIGTLQTLVAESGGWLGVYGDHQPSLPKAFGAAGLTDRRTDYALWSAHAPTRSEAVDIAAHELGALLVDTMRASA
jgi:hypothetical protein